VVACVPCPSVSVFTTDGPCPVAPLVVRRDGEHHGIDEEGAGDCQAGRGGEQGTHGDESDREGPERTGGFGRLLPPIPGGLDLDPSDLARKTPFHALSVVCQVEATFNGLGMPLDLKVCASARHSLHTPSPCYPRCLHPFRRLARAVGDDRSLPPPSLTSRLPTRLDAWQVADALCSKGGEAVSQACTQAMLDAHTRAQAAMVQRMQALYGVMGPGSK